MSNPQQPESPSPAAGSPIDVDLGEGAVTLRTDAGVYPLEALYGAAYVFIDRCYVMLDREGEERWVATLTLKNPTAEDARARLEAMAGEFGNELLACAWRAEITRQNRSVVEAVTMQAMAGAMGPPSLDELEEFDFSEEPFDDPLGIATSWEDKYKKKKANEGGSEGA